MEKIILSFLCVFLYHPAFAATKNVEGFHCIFQVDDEPLSFNLPYETQGHILTFIDGVSQKSVLGLHFMVGDSKFPVAELYTYQMSDGQQRLILQVVGPAGEVLQTQINDANVASAAISGEISKTLNHGVKIPGLIYDLSCSRL